MVIGLTGGSGTGKSTLSGLFLKKGYKIIDGDRVSRAVTEKGSKVLEKIAETFGTEFLNEDKTLNRRKLGALVFSDSEALEKLNEITHPAITAEVKRLLEGEENAVLEGAAIFKCDMYKLCDKIIFVSCPKDVRIKRITERDNISFDYALSRIEAQESDEYYRERCDFEIVNDGVLSIEKQLEDLGL